MGKIRLGNSVFLLLISILSFSLEVWGRDPDPQRIRCPYRLEQFSFVGTAFRGNEAAINETPQAGEYFCIIANSDSIAIPSCSRIGNPRHHSAMNPGNGQYHYSGGTLSIYDVRSSIVSGTALGSSISIGAHDNEYGNPNNINYSSYLDSFNSNMDDRIVNNLNFYYCVPISGPNFNSKERACNDARARERERGADGIFFSWGIPGVPYGTDEDRDCVCAASLSGPYSDSCNTPQGIADVRAAVPQQAPVEPAPDAQDDADGPVATAVQNFNRCVDSVSAQASQCQQAGRESREQCSSGANQNTMLGGTASVAGGLAQAHNQANVGTGAQDSCFQASLLSNAALYAANSANNTCRDKLNSCESNCGTDSNTLRVQMDSCLTQLNEGNSNPVTMETLENSASAQGEGNLAQAAQYYQAVKRELETQFRTGYGQCETARQTRSELENLISGVGRSLQSAAQCSCQYASSTANTQQVGTSNACATNLPNPNACATNPSLPGCEVYRELSPCTPGATYNAQMCRCQTNPSAVGCEGTQTTGTVASMAGSSIRAGAVAGPTGFGIPAGGAVARNGIDLGGGSDGSAEGLQLDNKNGRAQIPKDPSVAGGGGAPPGGGATRDNGGLAGAGGEEKTLAAGLMNAAKNIGKALGLTKEKPNGNLKGGGKGGGNKEPNLNSFRPRNVAGGRDGMGGKHMDIWKMMNKCVQAETCQSNMNNYILTP